MYPYPALGGRAPPIVYRSSTTTIGAGVVTMNKPAGVAVGDIVIHVLSTATPALALTTTSGGSWTKSAITLGALEGVLFWKLLDATDVSNNWTANAIDFNVVSAAYVGNGASAISIKQALDDSANTAGTTMSLTGFTPSWQSRGMITGIVDDDATAPTAPTGSTRRVEDHANSYAKAIADNAAYTGGAITWGVASGAGQVGWALEAT